MNGFSRLILAGVLNLAIPIAMAAGGASPGTPPPAVVVTGSLALPSGVTGSTGSALEQIDEVVGEMHSRLASIGLGIGSMIQHTIYVKDGAVPPIDAINRFHAAARRLDPRLEQLPSVGTILRVPAFADSRALVGLDVVASSRSAASLARVPFTFGPKEIVESVADGQLTFTAGLEAMNFENGTLVPTIDEQIEVVVTKLDQALKKAGLTLEHMVSHNIYVTRGTDPSHVIEQFHAAMRKRAPGIRVAPSVETLALVDGMAIPGFLLEVDAIAARADPGSLLRVQFAEGRSHVPRSSRVGDLVLASSTDALDPRTGLSEAVSATAQAGITARRIHATLRESGLGIADVAKYRFWIAKGEDVNAVLAAFRAEAAKLSGDVRIRPAAQTVIVVEGLKAPGLRFAATAIAASR